MMEWQMKVDVDIDSGQLLINLATGIKAEEVKELFWRVGCILNRCNNKNVHLLGEAIEKALALQEKAVA